jgi:ribosomal protein S18 acetylase RimI-like enzyme
MKKLLLSLKCDATSGLVFFQRPPYNGNLSGLEAYIMNIDTIPMWRDQGIATALLKEIISFVRATEAKRLWLHATEDGKSLNNISSTSANLTEG